MGTLRLTLVINELILGDGFGTNLRSLEVQIFGSPRIRDFVAALVRKGAQMAPSVPQLNNDARSLKFLHFLGVTVTYWGYLFGRSCSCLRVCLET